MSPPFFCRRETRAGIRGKNFRRVPPPSAAVSPGFGLRSRDDPREIGVFAFARRLGVRFLFFALLAAERLLGLLALPRQLFLALLVGVARHGISLSTRRP